MIKVALCIIKAIDRRGSIALDSICYTIISHKSQETASTTQNKKVQHIYEKDCSVTLHIQVKISQIEHSTQYPLTQTCTAKVIWCRDLISEVNHFQCIACLTTIGHLHNDIGWPQLPECFASIPAPIDIKE